MSCLSKDITTLTYASPEYQRTISKALKVSSSLFKSAKLAASFINFFLPTLG